MAANKVCGMSNQFPNLFYDPAYMHIQGHENVRTFDEGGFRIVLVIEDGVAKSLPRGLFGSFKGRPEGTYEEFQGFVLQVIQSLKDSVKKIEVMHPSNFYTGWVPDDWMKGVGFLEKYAEINHHIDLSNFHLHPMEQRKLDKLVSSDFKALELSKDHLKEAHGFLARCREEKGLALNISLERLNELFITFPNRYSIFGTYQNCEMTSAVITVRITEEVVYYYLPGTLEAYKKESPMVGLIYHSVTHYKDTAKYLDLGVSSVYGKPQEGLIAFKERMGGVLSEKKVLSLNLDQFPSH